MKSKRMQMLRKRGLISSWTDEIEPIIPPEIKRTRSEKWRQTRFLNKLKAISGVNPDLIGPSQSTDQS